MEVTHWRRTHSNGKVHVLCERLIKSSPVLDEGYLESRSDGILWIHWRRTDSDGKIHVLFVRCLEKFHPCWMGGRKSI